MTLLRDACYVFIAVGGLCVAAHAAETSSIPSPYQFDTDRAIWVVDTDGDGYPDLSEQIRGTNPYDAAEHPAVGLAPSQDNVGFPTAACRAGFTQAGNRLCINTFLQGANFYDNASTLCRNQFARVCTYEDLYYLYTQTALDGSYNPNGNWLGDFVGDDTVLCGNRDVTFNGDVDIFNFEGNCSKDAARNYWCCHDRE